MSDIELVIKIPKDIYIKCHTSDYAKKSIYFDLIDIIRKGVQLPKGHGRLIDANELKKIYDERITYLYTLNKKDNPSRESKINATNWCINTVDELPTIIKADKESD